MYLLLLLATGGRVKQCPRPNYTLHHHLGGEKKKGTKNQKRWKL